MGDQVFGVEKSLLGEGFARFGRAVSLVGMTDTQEDNIASPEPLGKVATSSDESQWSDRSLLSAAACAVSTVYIATHSTAATVAMALVAAVVALCAAGRR